MLSFDDFKNLAKDDKLASYEKVGFGQKHRGDLERNIFPSVLSNLSNLRERERERVILDVGCGCSLPAVDMIEHCKKLGHKLVMMDSKEQLDNLPVENYEKVIAQFPECQDFIESNKNSFDVILVYSVLHHVFFHQNVFRFLDNLVCLLKSQGELLVADIPNISKKKRFLASEYGAAYHKSWSGTDENPVVEWNSLDMLQMDDSFIFSILARYRNMGCETYLLPQANNLPMSNTREDILIKRN